MRNVMERKALALAAVRPCWANGLVGLSMPISPKTCWRRSGLSRVDLNLQRRPCDTAKNRQPILGD